MPYPHLERAAFEDGEDSQPSYRQNEIRLQRRMRGEFERCSAEDEYNGLGDADPIG